MFVLFFKWLLTRSLKTGGWLVFLLALLLILNTGGQKAPTFFQEELSPELLVFLSSCGMGLCPCRRAFWSAPHTSVSCTVRRPGSSKGCERPRKQRFWSVSLGSTESLLCVVCIQKFLSFTDTEALIHLPHHLPSQPLPGEFTLA